MNSASPSPVMNGRRHRAGVSLLTAALATLVLATLPDAALADRSVKNNTRQ